MKLIFFLLWLYCGAVSGDHLVGVSLYDPPQTTFSSTPVGGVDEFNKEMLQKITMLRNQGKSDAEILKECVDAKAFLVKLTAALGMGLCGLDMQAAYDAADCAIENNCGQYLIRFLVCG